MLRQKPSIRKSSAKCLSKTTETIITKMETIIVQMRRGRNEVPCHVENATLPTNGRTVWQTGTTRTHVPVPIKP
jgi:hypothetical protein